MRARELGITLGLGVPRGAVEITITDVPGFGSGTAPCVTKSTANRVRTGVTLIQPRAGHARRQPCFAGCHVLNGNGDATGLEWIREAGLLATPIAITNTHSVGVVRDALVAQERDSLADPAVYWCMPVVMETYDGVLNDIWGQHVGPQHVAEAAASASAGPVAGRGRGGTGMICHEFWAVSARRRGKCRSGRVVIPSVRWSRPTMANAVNCGWLRLPGRPPVGAKPIALRTPGHAWHGLDRGDPRDRRAPAAAPVPAPGPARLHRHSPHRRRHQNSAETSSWPSPPATRICRLRTTGAKTCP